MSSTWGNAVRLSIFGESHGPAVGAVLDGLPAGETIDLTELQAQMARRAPGGKAGSTARTEADRPHILSGTLPEREDKVQTTGAPLCAVIENTNTNSQDYEKLRTIPRPSHADYTGAVRYGGRNDGRGGGHFSGRLTAPLVFAGAVARQILARRGIVIGAHLYAIGPARDTPFDPCQIPPALLADLSRRTFGVLDARAEAAMRGIIEQARKSADSVGGVVECAAAGLPAGIGSPMFDGLESRLASLLYGIPAVKGVEFGDGFAISRLTGSEANDPMRCRDGAVVCTANHNGGILGGISNGMPLLLRVAVKPTASIGKPQESVDLQAGTNAELVVRGRHDSCIVPRALPVVESAVALALLDAIFMQEGTGWKN